MTTRLQRSGAVEFLFVALIFAIGIQMLRMLFYGLVFYLSEVRGLSFPAVGAVALLIFATAFLAPVVFRFLGTRGSLLAGAVALAALRLAEQLVASPAVDFTLSVVGVVVFLPLIPLSFALVRGEEERGPGLWYVGLLMGLSIETAVKGGMGTLDASWQTGLWADIVVASLVIVLIVATARMAVSTVGASLSMPGLRSSIPLLAVGPFLFLEMLLFQNVAQQTALIEWPLPLVLAWIVAANGAGVILAGEAMSRRLPAIAVQMAAILLVVTLLSEQAGVMAAVTMLLGHLSLALLLAATCGAAVVEDDEARSRVVAWSAALGMAFFLVLTFAYYARYDIDIPVNRPAMLIIAALLAAVPALLGRKGEDSGPGRNAWAQALGALLLVSPLFLFLSWDRPEAVDGSGLPVRAVTYNIHQGFSTDGEFNLEAIAQAVESQEPDIVALQEVSRGWLINGSVDSLTWLSRRLDMPYVWGPAQDSALGNVVLSRFPVTSYETHEMPNNDELNMNRGFISMVVDTGGGSDLRVIATHLHAWEEEGHLRAPQVAAILDRWGNSERTVLLGDFNSLPDSPEIEALRRAGFKDAYVTAGSTGLDYSYKYPDGVEIRIDYIWVTPDLAPSDYEAVLTGASDHLPVAVTIDASR